MEDVPFGIMSGSQYPYLYFLLSMYFLDGKMWACKLVNKLLLQHIKHYNILFRTNFPIVSNIGFSMGIVLDHLTILRYGNAELRRRHGNGRIPSFEFLCSLFQSSGQACHFALRPRPLDPVFPVQRFGIKDLGTGNIGLGTKYCASVQGLRH
jgi:hypothetical protein